MTLQTQKQFLVTYINLAISLSTNTYLDNKQHVNTSIFPIDIHNIVCSILSNNKDYKEVGLKESKRNGKTCA